MPPRFWTVIAGFLRPLAGRRAAPSADLPAEDSSPWLALRSVPAADDELLSAQGEAWLNALPDHARPKRLAARHPRVVNRLAQVWSDLAAAGHGLDRLLVDERGDRGGFSPAIRAELKRLQYLHGKLIAEPYRPAGAAGPQLPASISPAPAPQATAHSTNT